MPNNVWENLWDPIETLAEQTQALWEAQHATLTGTWRWLSVKAIKLVWNILIIIIIFSSGYNVITILVVTVV